MNSSVREISLIGKTFDYMQKEYNDLEDESNQLFNVFSLEIKNILMNNDNLFEKRLKMYRYLLEKVNVYKNEISNEDIIPKEDAIRYSF